MSMTLALQAAWLCTDSGTKTGSVRMCSAVLNFKYGRWQPVNGITLAF